MDLEKVKSGLSRYADLPFREHQAQAIRYVLESDKRFVFLEAPTGSGKSLIAMVAGLAMGGVTYAVHSKILQHQITEDFPEAISLFGRSNYPCLANRDVTCDECFHTAGTRCQIKGSCTYEIQKRKVLSAGLRILNYDYLLSEANYVGRFSNQDCVIVDEADNLENTLINFVTLIFTDYGLGRLGLRDEIDRLKKTSKDGEGLIESWKSFCRTAKYRTASIIDRLDRDIKTFNSPLSDWETKQIKERNRIFRLQEKIDMFIENADQTWLYDNSQSDRHVFRPLWLTEDLAEKFMWRHSRKWVFMSASFLPIRLEAKRLGIPFEDVDYHLVPSSFPVERRPIHIMPAADLTSKTMDAETPKLIAAIRDILDNHPDEKGLIHAVSYKLAAAIADGLDNPRVLIHNSDNRQQTLDAFMESDRPYVLLSPSMERGVSLKMDLCRFIIVAKAPFLYLGDRIVAARVYGSKLGKEWYAAQMLSTVLQMTGRGMRSADDSCTSYILDAQFQRVFNQKPLYLPSWWRDAVAW
jgi:Rad3-related DNA helicase